MKPKHPPTWPWWIEGDTGAAGTLVHLAAPRFRARWTTGHPAPGPPAGGSWTDAGAGDGEDAIHIFEVAWTDTPPGETALQALMARAARALDAWIARRL